MCCPPSESMMKHLDETGDCLMCSNSGQWGMLPCPYCREDDADNAARFIVAPLMVLSIAAISVIIVMMF